VAAKDRITLNRIRETGDYRKFSNSGNSKRFFAALRVSPMRLTPDVDKLWINYNGRLKI
jgi:hypothetical protein